MERARTQEASLFFVFLALLLSSSPIACGRVEAVDPDAADNHERDAAEPASNEDANTAADAAPAADADADPGEDVEPAWRPRSPSSPPSARARHAMAYESSVSRVIMFGGDDDKTWAWNGESWSDVSGGGERPDGLTGHSLAYDAERQQIIYAGVSSSDLPETWAWSGVTWASLESSPFYGSHRLAYDAARQRVVGFGGVNLNPTQAPARTTGRWNGSEWTTASPDTPPDGRANHAMAYDTARERIVLFGGFGQFNRLGDTWEWNGADWNDVTPSAESPSPRTNHAMVYDEGLELVILFGGNDDDGELLDETWTWDGVRWRKLELDERPPPRHRHAMAYDRERAQIVLFGGDDDNGPVGDTWVFGKFEQ